MHIPARVRECRFRSAASAYEASSSDFASYRQRRIDIASMRFDIAVRTFSMIVLSNRRTSAIVQTDYVDAAERARRYTPASPILHPRAVARVSHFIRAYVRFQSRFYIASLSPFLSLEKFRRNFAMKYPHCSVQIVISQIWSVNIFRKRLTPMISSQWFPVLAAMCRIDNFQLSRLRDLDAFFLKQKFEGTEGPIIPLLSCERCDPKPNAEMRESRRSSALAVRPVIFRPQSYHIAK